MITKMASKVADFFIYRNWIEKDEHEIYRYGMEVILNNVGDNTYNSAVLIDNVLVA